MFEIAARDPKEYIPMKRLDPMMGVSYKDRTKFSLSNDLVELMRMLENISEKEASGFLLIASRWKRNDSWMCWIKT